MLIHTDHIEYTHLIGAIGDALPGTGDIWLQRDVRSGSRRRDHKWDVLLRGELRGGRLRLANTGRYGADTSGQAAATWMEWGWWIACLFRFEPTAIIGQYDGRDDFHRQTAAMFQSRCKGSVGLRKYRDERRITPEVSPFADLTDRPASTPLVNPRDLQEVEAWLAS